MAPRRARNPVSLRYEFRQNFSVPARAAFAWCTDFGPGDGRLFSHRTRRSVRWWNEDTAMLTDTTYPEGRPVRIRRLVRIDPGQLAWTNTHLDGPYRFSQYWYRVRPRGRQGSVLEFRGHRILWVARRPGPAAVPRLAEAERRADSTEWRTHLAAALERDLGSARHPRGARRR